MKNFILNLQTEKISLLLIVCYLFMAIPINWILQYFLKQPWPDWLYVIFSLIEYLVISLLIWVERYHLEENNFDFWSLFIYLIFGSLLRPTITTNKVVFYVSGISFTLIGFVLFLGLRKNHIRLSKSFRPFLWLFVGSLFCIIELFAFANVGIPFTGISGPTKIPIYNYTFSFIYFLCNTAISEETIFRGFLWGTLHRFGYSAKRILVAQAVLFAIVHIRFFQPESIISYFGGFLFALLWGFLAWKSRSIFPSIISHAFQNTIYDLIH